MQFFAWGINHPGVADRRAAIIREHWDFIARYEDRLIARGPVLNPADPAEVTGSIHVADLGDWDAARHFAYDEPFFSAGLFEDVLLKRFESALGRTQFEFKGAGDLPKYFVYCPAAPDALPGPERPVDAYDAYCRRFDSHFLCRGALIDDRGGWDGSIYLMEMAGDGAVRGFLDGEPYFKASLYGDAQVHRWTPGGPENLSARGELTADA